MTRRSGRLWEGAFFMIGLLFLWLATTFPAYKFHRSIGRELCELLAFGCLIAAVVIAVRVGLMPDAPSPPVSAETKSEGEA